MEAPSALRFDELDFGPGRAPGPAASVLRDVLEGRRLGVVVRGVLPLELAAQAVRSFAGRQAEIAANPAEYYEGRVFGRLLTTETELERYFDEAGRFAQAFDAVAGGEVRARIDAVLAHLGGGQPVEPARDARGRAYLALSVREMLPGGSILPHYENEALDCPQMAELAARLTPRAQVSVYVPLQVPQAGGILRLYALREEHAKSRAFMTGDRQSPAALAALDAEVAYLDTPVGAGDLLVFDASRYVHRVTKVEGARSRWTMGCFVGREAGGALVRWT